MMSARSIPMAAFRIGLLTVAVVSLVAGMHLVRNEMNPTIFIAIGEEDAAIREYAERLLDDVFLRPQLGHDGRFFFVQANDPWLLDSGNHAEILDRPVYRTQRMAYPVLASAGGILSPEGVVWGMLVVNILALGLGAYVCSILAVSVGGSKWWGLIFPLNVGLMSEFAIGGGGIVAAAIAFAAVLALTEDRIGLASLLFAIASLSREVMLIGVAGAVVWLLINRRLAIAIRIALPSLLAVGVWAMYIRWVLPEGAKIIELGPPLVGLVQNWENWLADPFEFLVGSVVVLLLVFYTYRAWKTPSLTAWTFLPFAALGFFLAEPVWDGYFNVTRAVAPILTAYFLITFAPSAAYQANLVRSNPLRQVLESRRSS